MARIKLVLALVLIASSLLAGCQPSASAPPTSAPQAQAPAAAAPTAQSAAPAGTPTGKPQPKPDGTLVVAIDGWGEETFLPHLGASARMVYMTALYDFPFYLSHETGQVMPGLVTKWQPSPDALTWTFAVRQGVKFHSGNDLTAEDIQYTLELLRSKDSLTSRAATYRDVIKSIEVVDPYNLRIQLSRPYWGFVEELAAGQQGFAGVVDKKYVDKVGLPEADRKPIGSGPYRFLEQKKGDSIRFEAVESHWRVVPEFKTLTIKLVPSEATRVAMLQTGEADIAPIGPASVEPLKKAGLGARQVPVPGGNSTLAIMSGPWLPGNKFYKPDVPWADKRVREALAISVNRDEIAKNLYMGFAVPMGTYVVAPGWQDFKPYPYDLDRAKKLMAEAGFANGFEVTVPMFEYAGTSLPLLAQAASSYWSKLGVRLKLAPTDMASIMPDIRTGATAGKIFFMSFPTLADVEQNLVSAHSSGPAGRFPAFMDPKLDQLLGEAAKTTDATARQAKLKEIQQYVKDEFGVIPVVKVDAMFGVSKKVGDWPGGPSNAFNLEYVTHAPALGTFRLFTP